MDIRLDGSSAQPLYLQLRNAMRQRLLTGAIVAGSRLPSSRELAGLLHVSRNTVDEAYRMLFEDGLTRIVRGQGTFACEKAETVLLPYTPMNWDASISGESRDYAHFREHEGRVDLGGHKVISFSSLAPDYHAFENNVFRRCLNTVLQNEGNVLLAYGYTRGYEPLRQYVRTYLAAKGLRMQDQEVLIVNGFRQGAGLVVKTLLSPGDCAAVEAPTYNGFLGILRERGVKACPVDCDEEGMCPVALEKTIVALGVRLVYLIPTYHNPTGRNMTLARRQAILTLCVHYGIPVLEDGFNEELRYRGECHPPMKALEGAQNVVYVGSFSKVLFPGLRVGWVVAPHALTRYLVHEKYNQDIHTPPLLQAALRQYCIEGNLDRHIRKVRTLYRERMDALYDALDAHFTGRALWQRVEGGFSAWLIFPETMDLRATMERAKEAGVLYAPGDAFYPDGRGKNCIRLGFSRLTPDQIAEGIAVLSDVIAMQDGGEHPTHR